MRSRDLIGWLLLGLASAGAVGWLLPRVYPFLPSGWEVSRAEAEAIARQRFTELGELPPAPYVVVATMQEQVLARQLLRSLGELSEEELSASPWIASPVGWDVRLFPRDAPPDEWRYQATVAPDGALIRVRSNQPMVEGEEAAGDEAGRLDDATAEARAAEYLTDQGIAVGGLLGPEVLARQTGPRADQLVRYTAPERLLGDDSRYGVQVVFQGGELAGFERWFEDPEERSLRQVIQQDFWVGIWRTMALVLLVPLVAVPFVRRYHEGEVGVRRGTQIFLLTLAGGIVAACLTGAAASQGSQMGIMPRQQVTWVVVLFFLVFSVFPAALLGALGWSVGEARVRERWGEKLSAFDALWRGRWSNATVAASSLRGTVLGLVGSVGTLLLARALEGLGFWPTAGSLAFGWGSDWHGLASVGWLLAAVLPTTLVACLFFGTAFYRRIGLLRSSLVGAALAWAVLLPPVVPLPLAGGAVFWVVWAAIPVLVFRRWDLLSAVLTAGFMAALPEAALLLQAADPWLQLQGFLPLGLLALPLAVSLRHLQGGRKLDYAWDDVPPHVRRIADRERQRVELETAREIQSSILPRLPPQLNGVQLAHAYLPATEVGGDFYDVLGLEDGRVAAAVGDVAGHGVSSGLVMSMVKSALAVQASFDPRVESVLAVLNRMVHQSARRRMLATLSYVLLDPANRELLYGSAGHIFPLRVSGLGRVTELEAGEYPLGVRPDYRPQVRRERVDPGDSIVLVSDGIVEARAERTDDLFGFERLEASLARHAAAGPHGMVQGILDDLARFTGPRPREDDVTLLVLKLSA